MASPWTEAIAVRRRWAGEAIARNLPDIESRPAGDLSSWRTDLEGEIERAFDDTEADPREAAINSIAIWGAFIDAMGDSDR